MKLKILSLITCIGIITYLYMLPELIKTRVTQVELATITTISHSENIVCSGKVEDLNQKDIYLQVPAVAVSVDVSVGDYIEKGHKLITFNQSVDSATTNNIDLSQIPEEYKSIVTPELIQSVLSGYSERVSGLGDVLANEAPKSLYSEYSGIVTAVNIKPGVIASTSTPAITISQIENYAILVLVNEEDIPSLEIGQEAVITGVGFEGKSYKGYVSQIYPTAKSVLNGLSQQTCVEALISITNPDEDLKVGFNTKVSIITSNPRDVLIIPYEAVSQDDEGEFVYVVGENSRLYKKYITTGEEYKEGFELVSGISSDDMVILYPDEIKNEGILVKF
ncbi:MAG: efflux RND transporter periplasmic adaptor subunit [Oscillospiraceae bacterium]|nr:efflux RND transporter periplasmic adaptor subunit [Oscillospiraceae bacterium]